MINFAPTVLEGSGVCHYSCCHLTANGASSVPLHTPGHSHAFQERVKLHLIPVGFLFVCSSQYLRSLSQWDILSIFYTLFWGLNIGYPSFVGSEMISEFTFCTLLDLFFLSLILMHICALSIDKINTSWDNTIHG